MSRCWSYTRNCSATSPANRKSPSPIPAPAPSPCWNPSPLHLLITDLRMPKMDGLQVLAIVRRKFPHLRIIVLTGVLDEEYRSRAYAQGVELFWQKPSNAEEIELFQDCIESLLGPRNRATKEDSAACKARAWWT